MEQEFLSKEELSEFRESNSSFRHFESQLAHDTSQVEILKHNRRSNLQGYMDSRSKIEKVTNDLKLKYKGDFNINLETGELIRGLDGN